MSGTMLAPVPQPTMPGSIGFANSLMAASGSPNLGISDPNLQYQLLQSMLGLNGGQGSGVGIGGVPGAMSGGTSQGPSMASMPSAQDFLSAHGPTMVGGLLGSLIGGATPIPGGALIGGLAGRMIAQMLSGQGSGGSNTEKGMDMTSGLGDQANQGVGTGPVNY